MSLPINIPGRATPHLGQACADRATDDPHSLQFTSPDLIVVWRDSSNCSMLRRGSGKLLGCVGDAGVVRSFLDTASRTDSYAKLGSGPPSGSISLWPSSARS